MMGRTHGVHAEPLTLGLKVALFYEEVRRSQERLDRALDGLSVGLISGAVGNFAHMPPELEEIVCEKLGLKPAPISSQILQRDRHAELMTAIAILGGTLEKLATEVRSLQKTECSELQEPFSRNQKGSSAMPHKRNPIICERITGMARVLRGYASVALENQALWHERDISHSGAERIIIPDACMLLEYMLIKMTAVVDDWVVHEDRMMKNIEDAYLIFYSQPLLLKLVDKGISREDAYRMVQRRAHRAFDEKMSFETLVREDAELAEHISKADCDEVFSLDRYKKHVGTLFNRLGI